MDNVLKFVVFDTDSCLSQWKLLLVTNFLFDLIHYHNLENLVMTSLFNSFYLNNSVEPLILMSTLFIYTNTNIAQQNYQSQVIDHLLDLTIPIASQLQIFNSLSSFIHFHLFYLKIIAVSISVILLLFKYKHKLMPKLWLSAPPQAPVSRPGLPTPPSTPEPEPRPCPPAPPNTPVPQPNPLPTPPSTP